MLLQWCTLEPSREGNLAAIRFSSPVRVQSIRVFPKDAKPFEQNRDIVSVTEPDAFYLHLYFNAYRVARPDSKEKPKPTNALVPTALAYAGSQTDFTVPMGNEMQAVSGRQSVIVAEHYFSCCTLHTVATLARGIKIEYATRLMIVRGSFERVSMAIYGDLMSELPRTPTGYEPKPLPTFEPIPISRALDPSNSLDPSTLARELLNLIPDAPPLPLAIRLVFCLKPPSDDWDLPDFPYLFADLHDDTENFDLEKAFNLTTRPVSDDIEDRSLNQFAENVAQSIREEQDSAQSYHVAGILSHAASQHPYMAKSLLDKMDTSTVFDPSCVDEATLIRLRDAATNADIARHLNNESFIQMIVDITRELNTDSEKRVAADRLISRIQSWAILEDTLSNTQGDFVAAARMLKEVCTDEMSLGIWLESMVAHEDIVSTLRENPLMPIPLPHPPYLFGDLKTSITHDEFVAFLRAVVGVAAVLAVYAFADAYPHKLCRERALGIIRLWQGVDGYREIVNHLLLLKQMIFRLECMMDNDPPRRAGVDAEHILVNLAKDPQAILQPDFIDCILGLKPPHAFITEEERMSMRRAAIVADDGLMGAIDELLRPMDHPPTLKHLRAVRVAFAVIDDELRKDREYDILKEFWNDGSHGLVGHLVDVLVPLVDDIQNHFLLGPPSRKTQELMNSLFCAADELLKLLLHLVPSYPLPSRAVRILTTSVTDLFACTDAADMLYSQSSPICIAAQECRQTCIDTVRMLSNPTYTQESGKLGAEVVLKTLLQHALCIDDRDPVHHVQQALCLIDYLLPMPDAGDSNEAMWIQRVIPMLLPDLRAFCDVLDTENRVHFVKRLNSLDRGVVGVAEWLIIEALKDLSHVLSALEDPSLQLQERVMRQFQISMALRFILDLASTSSAGSRILVECLKTAEDATTVFTACLSLLLEQRIASPALEELAETLASESAELNTNLRTTLAIAVLRFVDIGNPAEKSMDSVIGILSSMAPPETSLDILRQEIGDFLDRCGQHADAMDTLACEKSLTLLGWLIETIPPPSSTMTLHMHSASWIALGNRFREVDLDLSDRWGGLIRKVQIVEDAIPANPTIPLLDSVELSLQDLEELLQPHIPIPSTPPRKALNQDVLGLVTISPPALIRSPASTGLTKTYNNNDFRQLRQTPLARQNTSRLPSMHVDEFENAASTSSSVVPVPVPMPMPVAMPTMAIPFGGEGFQPLSAPPFNPM